MFTLLRPLTARRRLLVMAALLVGTIAPAGTRPTTAAVAPQAVQAAYIIETFYYSNSSRTEEIGYSIRRCDGSYSLFGQTSSYYTTAREPCG